MRQESVNMFADYSQVVSLTLEQYCQIWLVTQQNILYNIIQKNKNI